MKEKAEENISSKSAWHGVAKSEKNSEGEQQRKATCTGGRRQ